MRQVGQLILINITQPMFHDMIKCLTLEILWDDLRRFTITWEWTNQFVKQYIN
jgi:hypothetical protein